MDMTITAESLYKAACQRGITAFDGPAPMKDWDVKILIGSLGLDVTSAAVRDRLAELNREGKIKLSRVDLVGAIPASRRAIYEAGRFYHYAAWFDVITFPANKLPANIHERG